ncbi:MAG TPA: GGDEF domain-containing response regulator, partial [Cyanobacteria bacterium UBA11049]|nr:GGDEF domain-containing response regulator [Cyanobacteria bacterium UBA11049]
SNGRVGIQLAQEQLPDLILCDVMMPELDGYGVLNALRQNPATAAIPFIFTTAKASKTDLRQGMELGADDYLTKPFTADELLGAIATRLKKQAVIVEHYTTELKQVEAKLNCVVYYDNLTNLPNQNWWRENLNSLLVQAESNKQLLPILLLSLTQFHQINSTLGNPISDLLIKAVAQRLRTCLGDRHEIVRLPADQFAIMLTAIEQKEAAANLAQTILNVFSQPFILNNYEVFINTSIGITLYPVDGGDIDTLIKNAHLAMYLAKQQKGDNYQFYTRDIDVQSLRKLLLDTDLHYALERGEFQVYYQPQVKLQTGKIVGAEALLRWQHPEWGFVSPAEFIPIAEENGLIISIGEWVLRTVCSQAQVWQAAGFSYLRMAVNISSRQLSQPNFTQKLAEILQETRFNPQHLELELTESITLKNTTALSKMKEIKFLGVKLSLDDFGTDYSALNYLNKLPLDALKIDKYFVDSVDNNSTNAAIVTAIIQMSRSLNLKTIAEGVETEAELAFLRQQQCDEIQGYLFSRPLPALEFEKLLTTKKLCPAVNV